jgi:hypothetical protein
VIQDTDLPKTIPPIRRSYRTGPGGEDCGLRKVGGFASGRVNTSRITHVEQASTEESEDVCPKGSKQQYIVQFHQFGGLGLWLKTITRKTLLFQTPS